MLCKFNINYKTRFGENLYLKYSYFNESLQPVQDKLPMQYQEPQHWQVQLDLPETKTLPHEFAYTFELHKNGTFIKELQTGNNLDLKKIKAKQLYIYNDGKERELLNDIFSSRALKKLTRKTRPKESNKISGKNATHIFNIQCNVLAAHVVPCLLGSCSRLHNWKEKKPLLLQKQKGNWVAKVNLADEKFPVEYKVALFDSKEKKVLQYEAGANRILDTAPKKNQKIVVNFDIDFPDYAFKAAGINFPVTALKTSASWGIGDFSDLKQYADFAKAIGLRLIQLLPLNDTTATHTRKDSYPYAAISAFALHPVLLDVEKLCRLAAIELEEETDVKIKALNALDHLDYEGVTILKQEYIRKVFEKEQHFFKDDFDWFEFFEINRHWLTPYAVFCYLRDKNKTADFNQWPAHATYNEDAIIDLAAADTDHYNEIALHYFTQYHLHLQLKEAAEYANKLGLVLKADLPIGVGRHSVETWMNPELFHLDKQAGAPPDDFSDAGQNWNFPTYNWPQMSMDNYAWWRQRMEHLSNYFDAVRIDHILGFFRIWSIPLHSQNALLGYFVKAKALQPQHFTQAGLYFNKERFTQPFITNDILENYFGDQVAWINEIFLNGEKFKPQFETQEAIANYFAANPHKAALQPKLNKLLADVILIEEEGNGFHFRIHMYKTASFKALPLAEQQILKSLYDAYFYQHQNKLWKDEGIEKLQALKSASNEMLLCGEDLGMVPDFVPDTLEHLQILCLQVERMPKKETEIFASPATAPYATVVTPGTHDMSTLRGWWEEDRDISRNYYQQQLQHAGEPPAFAEAEICEQIIEKHLQSPAIFSVFLMQDILASNASLRKENPHTERINIPANANHYWNYRMHISLEAIMKEKDWLKQIKQLVKNNHR